jgi:hypothetical protein
MQLVCTAVELYEFGQNYLEKPQFDGV